MTTPFDYVAQFAREKPDAVAVVSPHVRLTFAELWDESRRLASALRKLGVKPGNIVAYEAPSSLELVLTVALFHEGVIGCRFEPFMAEVQGFTADWILSNNDIENSSSAQVLRLDAQWLSAHTTEEPGDDFAPMPYASPDAVCRLVFSSGTTGTPKAVPLGVQQLDGLSENAPILRIAEQPVMTILPIKTMGGLQFFTAGLKRGNPFFLGGNAEETIALLHEWKIKTLIAAPSTLAGLSSLPQYNGEWLSALTQLLTFGGMIPLTIVERLNSLPGIRLQSFYGSSEAGLIAIREEGNNDDPFLAGTLPPNVFVEIVDEADRVSLIRHGDVGLIRVKAALMATKYFNNPDASAEMFRDGWFYPGDRGWLTEKGDLHLAGRSNEVINQMGMKIDPNRVDDIMLRIDGVRDVGSFGFTEPSGKTLLGVAFVPEGNFIEDTAREIIQTTLRKPVELTFFEVASLPRNDMGKVVRRELSERYSA